MYTGKGMTWADEIELARKQHQINAAQRRALKNNPEFRLRCLQKALDEHITKDPDKFQELCVAWPGRPDQCRARWQELKDGYEKSIAKAKQEIQERAANVA